MVGGYVRFPNTLEKAIIEGFEIAAVAGPTEVEFFSAYEVCRKTIDSGKPLVIVAESENFAIRCATTVSFLKESGIILVNFTNPNLERDGGNVAKVEFAPTKPNSFRLS